jgi:hypothetical protein
MDLVHASRGGGVQSNSPHRAPRGDGTHHAYDVGCMHSRYGGGGSSRSHRLAHTEGEASLNDIDESESVRLDGKFPWMSTF